MYQQHSFNANGKLLRRFYEPLVLLRVLDPTRGKEYPDLILDRGLEDRSKLWRNFLDRISFLCDSEKGGDTVTAVAAERTIESSVFWVASNSRSRYKAQELLTWLFANLQHVYDQNPKPTNEIEAKITARCLEFSSSRIKDYTRSLLQAIRRVRTEMRERTDSQDTIVLHQLEQIERLTTDPQKLCAYAYTLRTHESMKILYHRHNGAITRNSWSDLRHYIGRLGYWTKAIKTIICGAKTFSQHIENARVKVIDPHELIDLPEISRTSNLEGVVQRMLRMDQTDVQKELNQALSEANAIFDLESNFLREYANMKPRPHAELLVLEHFYEQRLEFIADDKYIGCSKPSCYCCHLYMQSHPGGFTPRPRHGNLWINWAPPRPLPASTRESTRDSKGLRPQDHHTFKMLQEMVVPVRRDLQDQILSRRPKRHRLPDSTTGMSSILFDVDTTMGYIPSGAPDRILTNEGRRDLDMSDFSSEIGSDDFVHDASFEEEDGASRHPKKDYKHTAYMEPQLSTGPKDAHYPSSMPMESEDDEDGDVILFKGRKSL